LKLFKIFQSGTDRTLTLARLTTAGALARNRTEVATDRVYLCPRSKKKRKLDPEVGPTGWSCTQVHLETIRGKQERKLAELLLKLKMLHAILS